MNTSPATPFGLPDTAPDLARRFAMIMAGLGALVARRFLRMPHLARFTLQLWAYLNRAVRRFHHALTKPTTPRARSDRADIMRARPPRLPSGRGWIVRALGWEAAAYLGQLEALLAEVATRAALAHAPAAGRIVRPICRMLGVSAEVTPKPPAAATKLAAVRAVPPAVKATCSAPSGLPAGVGKIMVSVTSG